MRIFIIHPFKTLSRTARTVHSLVYSTGTVIEDVNFYHKQEGTYVHGCGRGELCATDVRVSDFC